MRQFSWAMALGVGLLLCKQQPWASSARAARSLDSAAEDRREHHA